MKLNMPITAGKSNNADGGLLFGHRGAGFAAPENTVAAIKTAIRLGLDGAEIDLRLSKDGEVVVFHDESLERMVNGSGLVRNKTTSELKNLRVKGSGSERIPALEEILGLVNGKIILLLELKSAVGIVSDGLETRVVEIVRNFKAFDWVIVESFNPIAIWRVRKLEPKIATSFTFSDKLQSGLRLPWILRREWFRRVVRKIIKPDFLEPQIRVEHNVLLRLAKQYPLILWSINNATEFDAARDLNPFAIITDEPEMLLEIRKSAP